MKNFVLLLLSIFIVSCNLNNAKKEETPYKKYGFSKFENKHGREYFLGDNYKIGEKVYFPKENYSYEELGVASWYGPNKDGESTINGGVFDMYDITAAHRTLPIPSVVRVTNLLNGRTLVVVINDRGPQRHDRIINLSKRSAKLLGILKNGSGPVHVKILERESKMLKESMYNNGFKAPNLDDKVRLVNLDDFKKKYVTKSKSQNRAKGVSYLKFGVYSKLSDAKKVYKAIKHKGRTFVSKVNLVNGKTMYTVKMGPFSEVSVLNNIKRYFKAKGINAIVG